MTKRTPHRYAHEPLWKRYLPHSLFGRAFLIMALPIVLLQIIAYGFFYERHWDSVTRNLARSLSGEVLLLVDLYERNTPLEQLTSHANQLGFLLTITENKLLRGDEHIVKEHRDFYEHMQRFSDIDFSLMTIGEDENLHLLLQLEQGKLMELIISKKRLGSSTTTIFLLWLSGSSLLLVLAATQFLRNQIRPIRQLARAAKRFGLGQEAPDFRPRGAREVRQAGRAFVEMRDRLQRYISTRTEMLAGISHDLRTPLTRMKLQIAMSRLKEDDKQALESDIVEMEHMIGEYLAFAKGEAGEAAMQVNITQLLEDIIQDYQQQDAAVVWAERGAESLAQSLKPRAFRRAVQNLINNALRYGERAEVSLQLEANRYRVIVEDNGPGIPEERQTQMFQAFKRMDEARTPQQGGAGLGLAIARDLVQAGGGHIAMENRMEGAEIKGLRVSITMPRSSS